MLYTEYDPEVEMRVVRKEALEDGIEIGLEEGKEKSRQYFLELLNHGLTIEEIKERLQQKEGIF
jgi:hypothetical protein